MPIDPKRIEDLKAAAGEAPADFEWDDEDSDGNWRYYSSPKAERFYDLARESVPALLTEREEMIALLRDIEWSGEEYLDYDLSHSACPTCRGIDPSEIEDDYDRGKASDANLRIGHAPDCRLAAVGKTK